MDDEKDDRTLLEKIPPTPEHVLKGMEDSRVASAHYSAIGQVAAQWGYFETIIDTWLMHLAGMKPEIAVCFTSQMMGPRPRVNAFIALARYLNPDKKWIAPLEQFAKEVTAVAERRNRVIHDMWHMEDPSQPMRLEASAVKSLRLKFVEHPTTDLIALIVSIVTLTASLDDMASTIFTEIHSRPPPSPDKA